jgi:hypothetical protein
MTKEEKIQTLIKYFEYYERTKKILGGKRKTKSMKKRRYKIQAKTGGKKRKKTKSKNKAN